jgi:hypothetical protein
VLSAYELTVSITAANNHRSCAAQTLELTWHASLYRYLHYFAFPYNCASGGITATIL